MRTLYLILIALVFFACSKDKSTIQTVTTEEMQAILKQDDVQLVDVRTEAEYNRGFIEDAQNVDFMSSTFDDDIKKLDKTKPVFLYCQKGPRSAKCAVKMEALGFTKIYDLEGGYSKWLSDQD